MRQLIATCIAFALVLGIGEAKADGQKLRIISWADYVPADLIAAFEKQTGIEVEVTLSNNEEMISKLRAISRSRPRTEFRRRSGNSASTSPSILARSSSRNSSRHF